MRSHRLAALVVLLFAPCPLAADSLSAGGYHAVRATAGAVLGLGDGTYGQLGTNPSGSPAIVAGLADVSAVAAGGFSTLALKADGSVWFLGESTLQHTTPHGTPNPVATPAQVAGLAGIDAIAAGHRHFLALDADSGQLFAWGHNGNGQVGNGGQLDVTAPALVLTGVTAMAAGDGFSLAVKSDGTLWSWGRNGHGQLGLGDTADRFVPTQVPGVSTAAKVEAGGQHSLVLRADGSVLAAGNNQFGQLGLGNTTSTSTPTPIPGLVGATALAAGYFHSGAFGPGSDVRVWGRNFEGQCGGGAASPVTYSTPQILAGLPATPVALVMGYHFTLIGFSDGTIAGTGSNADGQLDGSSVADQGNSRKVLSPQLAPFTSLPSDLTPPQLQSFSPANDSTGAAITGNLVMVFDEAIRKGSGSILIRDAWSNQVASTIDVASSAVTITSSTATIDPPVHLSNGTVYYLEVAPGAFEDLSGNPAAGIAGSTTWSFATAVATPGGTGALVNGSFETPDNPDATGRFSFGESRDFGPNGADTAVEGGDENNLTAWTTVTTENGGVNGAEIAVGFINITPAQGGQVLSLQSGASTRQMTDVAWSNLSAGDVITLTVAVGDRSTGSTWADQSFFALIDGDTTGPLANGTLLGSAVAHSGELATPFSGGAGIDSGTMQDRSISHTVLAADLARPGKVGVLLAAYGTVTDSSGGLTPNNVNQAFFDNVRLTVPTTAAGDAAGYLADPVFGLDPGDRGFTLDPDGDHLANGLEAWFGTHPGEPSQGLATVSSNGTVTTFTHPQNPARPTNVAGFYQWSPDLTTWYAGDGVDGPPGGRKVFIAPVTTGATTAVTATASGPLERVFLRVQVDLLPGS